jgi:hypothetical protein
MNNIAELLSFWRWLLGHVDLRRGLVKPVYSQAPHRSKTSALMSASGHSRPMHTPPAVTECLLRAESGQVGRH